MASAEDDLLPVDAVSDAALCRREFYLLCVTFGLNHATVTTPILFASSVLTNAAGQGGNAVLYFMTLICTLFFANPLFSTFGAKRGLVVSMTLYAAFVFSFAIASTLCDVRSDHGDCKQGQPYQLPVIVIGSTVGGLGAGLLWTCQGAFFALVCERLALAEGREPSLVTAELSGTWGSIFLAFECLVRALTTLLHTYGGLPFDVVFYGYAALAFLAAGVFALFATNLQKDGSGVADGKMCGKVLAAVQLWSDPMLWLLQPTNVTFGFAAAWLGGFVGRNILSKALNLGFLGFAGALLSGLAAILSKVFGLMSVHVGKGPVIMLGSLAFLSLGIFSKWVGDPAEWGYGVLLFYVFMGVGRAVYESTNKGMFADFFPGIKSAGAFANVFAFNSGASTVAFVLGASGVELPELYLLLFFASLTVPGFLLATQLKTQRSSSVDLHAAYGSTQ